MAISGLIDLSDPSYSIDFSGTTDNNTQLQSALDALSSAGAGMALFPEGICRLNPTGASIQWPDNVELVGTGRGSIISGGETALGSVPNPMFVPKTAGARMRARSLTMKGANPGSYPNVQTLIKALDNMTVGSEVKLADVFMERALFDVHVPQPASGTSVFDVILNSCRLTGLNGSPRSMGIDHHGSGGKVVLLGSGVIEKHGMTADTHWHGIYAGSAVDLDVGGQWDFLDFAGDGWAIQHYFALAGFSTARYSRIANAYFNTLGIATSERNGLRTDVSHCRFVMPSGRKAFNVRAEGRIIGGEVTLAGTVSGIGTAPDDVVGDGFSRPFPRLDVEDVIIRGASDQSIELVGSTSAPNANNGLLRVRGVRFFETPATANIRQRVGTNLRTFISDCDFVGGGTNISVYHETGAMIDLLHCFFDQAGTHVFAGAAMIRKIIACHFQQGTAVGGTAPSGTPYYMGNTGASAPAASPANAN